MTQWPAHVQILQQIKDTIYIKLNVQDMQKYRFLQLSSNTRHGNVTSNTFGLAPSSLEVEARGGWPIGIMGFA
jgi:hypothetical protein